MTHGSPTLIDDWLQWMRDFQREALTLTQLLEFDPDSVNDPELLSVKFALYARLLTFLDTAIRHTESDKLLDLRIVARNAIECGMHMDAASRWPDYLRKLKDDDKASRRSLAVEIPAEILDAKNRRIRQGMLNDKTAKRLQPTDLGKGSDFARLVLMYRKISSDTAHVTASSLDRHMATDTEGVTRLTIDPIIDDEELYEAFTTIALTLLLCTWLLMDAVPESSRNGAMLELAERYQSLYRRDIRLFKDQDE
ncbi:hypothetical protein ACFYE9_32475 [Rhizobium leguminosarum]|uniref:Uncharacterized protein n=2 Tax=Rhizobium leguminosarum TaxID=384 RepID=A0A154IIU9_RHILE|nr:hypothetical protein [Rhizobium leguminosarum]KZA99889.1 hypothetical protein A4A59_20930 [Rhizobium leguminosarum]